MATSTSDARLVSSDIEHRSAWTGPGQVMIASKLIAYANQRESRAFLLAWAVLCSVRLC